MSRNDWERVTLRLPPDLHQWLVAAADAEMISINSVIITALRQKMNEDETAVIRFGQSGTVAIRLDEKSTQELAKAIAAAIAEGKQ